ncbi:hypothetical protein HG535_0D01560 [Zygotorulaspora mrakii]|uniref:L-2-hydroxyglutarate dehydrogenase, mitochondrial n=1 Tax=Zygotorulaspora mrakii TaxID=42260 RepID=A0A7H9B1D4_ZYGMR|nr:uncharacterized protein HG535_0D01560 [Zygotorulaspora mrakii]QLG72448.1 hypothetical protein HG535_0D01560 [Zygotorulaspora mrakii]
MYTVPGLVLSRMLRSFSVSCATRSMDYSHVIVGGGVVGLAIAAELSKVKSNSVVLLEKNDMIGAETSSRNSEVIHAGIYYPSDSLKTKLCIEGKKIIYNELDPLKTGVSWRKCGKWVVSQTGYEDSIVEQFYRKCKDLNVDVMLLTSEQAKRIEPSVLVKKSVLNSPTSGIIDSHSLMEYLSGVIQSNDGEVITGSEVVDLQYKEGQGYVVAANDRFGDEASIIELRTENLINAAGLYADRICNMLLPNERHMKQYYARGNYFKLSRGGFPPVHRLIYPVPPKNVNSLGTHLTIDLDNQVRFGPDLEYVKSPTDYSPNPANIPAAYEAISTYYPYISLQNLEVSYSGIRPKLGGPGDKTFRDFYIKEEDGFPGFVNLLGIESPGLTASIAIGRYVKRIYHD